jgi:hypothetical protein
MVMRGRLLMRVVSYAGVVPLKNTSEEKTGLLKKFIIEVEKSGYSIDEILERCIEKSWGGFESDWFKKDLTSGYRKPTGGIRDSGLAF